ncbi:MAG TPA: UDP-N-acetylmuramate--L-alanine ligase, partial [Leeuwenhoekiella sp.]|nr:UDP-N-acetylmuramate--L-alanine ligase [Leeuwenhoekiella sp.]
LGELGIGISYQDAADAIPAEFKVLDKTLVVYTPAVPKAHKAYQFY